MATSFQSRINDAVARKVQELADSHGVSPGQIVEIAANNLRRLRAEKTERRCDGGFVDHWGECFACNAEQGEACRKPRRASS